MTLASDPDDAAAHAAVGKHACFNRQDWRQGLPHLARGDDAAIRAAAAADLESTTDPTKQKNKADA